MLDIGTEPGRRSPPGLAELDLPAHLGDPSRRQRFVTRMFDIIAPRYDRFTRVFSFGMDAAWKRALLAHLPTLHPGDLVVDLASGTGDFAVAVHEKGSGASVIGLDASQAMVREARARLSAPLLSFDVGDMSALPLADGAACAITSGYGFRNVPDFRAAIREAARVLRPGGRLLVLDFYRPTNALWRRVFLAYLRLAGNLVGWLWHGEAVVYGYIAPSIAMYVDAQSFAKELEAAGFRDVMVAERLLGGIALHVARR